MDNQKNSLAAKTAQHRMVGLTSLEYVENTIKSIRGQASQVNKNPDNL